MNTALLFATSHGRTRKAVHRAADRLTLRPPILEVNPDLDPGCVQELDLLVLFCPTYGDEELHDDMEAFIRRVTVDCSRLKFAICELGNYYGYDDFSFGAMLILRRYFMRLGAQEFYPPLSLDSMPRLNWGQLDRWIDGLSLKLSAYAPD